MTEQEFLDKCAIIEQEHRDGIFTPLCSIIDGMFGRYVKRSFQYVMRQLYWPGDMVIGSYFVGKCGHDEGYIYREFARMLCFQEWKNKVLKTKGYVRF